MEHSDSLPITKEEVPADRRQNQESSTIANQIQTEEGKTALQDDDKEQVKENVKIQIQSQQSYQVGISDKSKNSTLLVRKRRRVDPNGGQRPCFCFYEDYDQEFLQDISSHTLKQVRESKHANTNDFYYVENESHYGYHYFGYYYGPICPCFQMCECCKNLIEKNTARLGALGGGGGGGESQMCCCGLFNQADTCCKMIVDAWFYLICLPFRIMIETYKSIFRICCGGELGSVGGNFAQATCFDTCCQTVFNTFSSCYQCFTGVIGQACAPICQCLSQCLGTACMQSVTMIGGVAFKACINFISIPLQGLILLCTQMCQQIIVPCCECLVRNADICCEIFRCLG